MGDAGTGRAATGRLPRAAEFGELVPHAEIQVIGFLDWHA